MDENILPVQPLENPRCLPLCPPAVDAEVLPLRLALQPHGAPIEVTRPDTIIGRHSECDICLRLPDVSRRHCRLSYQDGQWHVFDLQSLNGTTVNGQRVDRTVLHHGDTLGLGGLIFEVDLFEGARTIPLSSAAERQVIGSISDALSQPAVRTAKAS